jgi:uncharacterized membrane protein
MHSEPTLSDWSPAIQTDSYQAMNNEVLDEEVWNWPGLITRLIAIVLLLVIIILMALEEVEMGFLYIAVILIVILLIIVLGTYIDLRIYLCCCCNRIDFVEQRESYLNTAINTATRTV